MSIKKQLETLKEGHAVIIFGQYYRVEKKSEYNEDGWKWPELKLTNLDTQETHFLEWEEDDELEIYLSTEKIDLDDLGFGLDNKEYDFSKAKANKKFEYKGFKYKYDDDYTAVFDGKWKVKFFDYYCKNMDQTISIEYWYEGRDKSDGFKVESYLCELVRPANIEIVGEFETT